MLIVGGTMPSVIAFIEIIASVLPAAPNMWPVIDFVELTHKFWFCFASPKTLATVLDSAISPKCVLVPCILM